MPDYLARVATSGMRTSIPAKPPVAGPPLLPGHKPLYFTADAEQGESQIIQHDVQEEQVLPVLPAATVTPHESVPPDTSENTQLESHAPSTKDATPIIQAPRALRPAYPVRPVPSTLHQEKAAQLSTSISPAPPTGAIGSLSSRTATSSDTPNPSSITPEPITPGVREPIDKRPIRTGVSPSPIVAVDEVQPVKPIDQSGTLQVTDKVRLEQEHDTPPTQAARKQMTTPPMLPARGNAPLMPPAHPTSRQVKLTIGRLDVQVNNQQTGPERGSGSMRSPGSALGTTPTDILERRYLDRFRLRP